MKIAIDRKLMLAALQRAKLVCATSTTLPILSYVRLSADAGKLEICANDLDFFLAQTLPCVVGESGGAAVSAARLAALLARLAADELTMSCNASRLRICGGDETAELCTLAVEEFPAAQELKAGARVRTEGFAGNFARVVKAASTDETRYLLNGILMEGSGICCTDGRRLHRLEVEFAGLESGVILPTRAVAILSQVAGEEPVELTVGEALLGASGEGWSFVAKLIEGNYPNYAQVIPSPSERAVTVSRARLLRAMPMASVFKTETIKLVEKDGALVVSFAQPDVGECEVKMEAEIPPGFSVKLCAEYLADAVNACTADALRIEQGADFAPVLIKDGALTAVMMPMRDGGEV